MDVTLQRYGKQAIPGIDPASYPPRWIDYAPAFQFTEWLKFAKHEFKGGDLCTSEWKMP